MEGRKILLLLNDKDVVAWTYRALAALGADIYSASTDKFAARILRNEPIDLVYMDMDFTQCLNGELDRFPRVKVGLVARSPMRDLISFLSSHPRIRNLISFNRPTLPVDGRDVIIATRKLIDKDIFGLNKYLIPGIPIHKMTLTTSKQKMGTIERIMAFAEQLGAKSRVQLILGNMIDELLLNAIYDAPVDEGGQVKYTRTIGKRPIQLNENEYVELEYASDGQYLYWAVRDQFGRLTREDIHTYLKRCFMGGQDQVLMSTGGAGLGFYNILSNINYFCANVAPGKQTEIIGMIDLTAGVRELKKRNLSFHYFLTED